VPQSPADANLNPAQIDEVVLVGVQPDSLHSADRKNFFNKEPHKG